MKEFDVLLVAGTHGNEINAPWLFEQWFKNPNLINTHGFSASRIIGNPAAFDAGKRYLDRDLNRSFQDDLLNSDSSKDLEVSRALELLRIYGPNGSKPCLIAIDIHSTTAAMGSSLVVYGRRNSDLALAALIQSVLGLPVYLHEGDQSQKGFLVESWPCGLVIEIGPVPQMILSSKIVDQTRIVLEVCFEVLASAKSRTINFPENLVIHKHLESIDFPRDLTGKSIACIHPELQGRDWREIQNGSPLFIDVDGDVISFQGKDPVIPVFINEASYVEKNIALSLTNREVLNVRPEWIKSLEKTLIS